MPRPKASSSKYAKRTFGQVVAGPVKSGAETLLGGVLQVFTLVDSTRFEEWLEECDQHPGVEREALLFHSLVCGTRFGVYRSQVAELQTELWQWLTWRPRNMRPELAEMLIEVLTPGLDRELKERENWRLGPSGPRGKQAGRPPVSLGAWAAALAIERYLRRQELRPAKSEPIALDLAAILTSRTMAAPEELRRAHRRLGKPEVDVLASALSGEFEWWVTHEALDAEDPDPGVQARAKYAAWRQRHRPLTKTLATYGADSFARAVLRRMAAGIWGHDEGVRR
jgi:hypothetical protein